jgi:hypothetical protein
LFGVLATLTALGLGAANPAFASGSGSPDPAATPVAPVVAVPEPEIAVPDVTSDVEFSTSAELDLPQVETSIQTDGVNTNVDVRVLSPGSNGAVAQADSVPEVVSAGVAPDITASSGESASTGASASEAARGPIATDSTDAAGPQGANTNVSVRILSPGDNGPVSQVGGHTEASPANAVEPPLPADSTAIEMPSSRSDSEQYQDGNSQYQFSDSSTTEPWLWSWILTSNCADSVDSISTETGDPESLDWQWRWAWTWGCDRAEDSSGTAGPNDRSSPNDPSSPTGTSASIGVSSTGRGGAEPSTTTQSKGTWSWTWTFVLCGTEMTVARTAASGTPLTWDWSWAWSWTCPSVANQNADIASGPADTTPRAERTVDDASIPSNAAITADAVERAADPTTASSEALDIRSMVALLQTSILASGAPSSLGWTPVTLTVDGLPSLVAFGVGLMPVDRTTILVTVDIGDTSSPIAPEATPIASQTSPTVLPWPDRTEQRARRPGPSATTRSGSAEPEFQARARAPRGTPEARPVSRPGSTSSSQGRREPVGPPFGPQGWLQLAGSASGAGGSSGVVPFGFFATVTGFFVLAPPRLRRRARPAQELGPRDRYPSPIDNPG